MSDLFYAIGDIHGQRAMLEDALARISKDGGNAAPVYFLGDYVDRGPDSRGVIDTLVRGQADGRAWHCVLGNHDRMFLRFCRDGQTQDARILSGKTWLHPVLGGDATLRSYIDLDACLRGLGVPGNTLSRYGQAALPKDLAQGLTSALKAEMPPSHLAFLDALPTHFEVGPYLMVHAGIRPGLPMAWQSADDMIWIRDDFLNDTRQHMAFVVHGHTPVEAPDLRLNRLNLDTGAGYGRPLTVAAFDADGIFVLGDTGRVRLSP